MHANTKHAWQEVIDDLGAVGLRATSGGRRYDLVLDIDGRTCDVAITRASVVSPAHVHALSSPEGTDAVSLLVADRISEAARRLLVDRGWSWLDRRGHAYVRAPGVLVDASFRPRDVVPTPRSAGRAWREVCFALLRQPQVTVGVRPLARTLDLSPAAVSGVLAQLREASLLDREGRPLLPELFWALAERWEVTRVALRRAPQPQDPDLELGLDASEAAPGVPAQTRGWALTDTVAATLYGAPLGVGAGWPPDFYVPDPVVLRRAVRAFGQAETWDDRGATAAVAPVRQVCSLRHHVPGTHWLLADPLAVALDLAQDTSRGVEVLRDWTPPVWAARVWA